MKKSVIFLGLFLAGQFLFSASVFGTIVNVPNDYEIIQDAINAALNGDTVHIEADTYTGTGNRNLYIPFGRNIVIRGEGPDATIIDLQGLSFDGFVFDFTQEDNNTIIRDLSVRNGRKGLHLVETGPRLINLKLVNNTRGIYYAMPFGIVDIENCQFINNDTGIAAYGWSESTFLIDSSTFESNDYGVYGAVTISNSEITGGISGIGCDISNSSPGNSFIADNCNIHHVGDTAVLAGYWAELNDCKIQNNLGIIAHGDASGSDVAVLRLSDCDIDNNMGGIFIYGDIAILFMEDCRYFNNNELIKFQCYNSGGAWINRCYIYEVNDTTALDISTSSGDIDIGYSVVAASMGTGIKLSTTSGLIRLYSNTIADHTDFGVWLFSSGNYLNIDSNVVAGCNVGIRLEDIGTSTSISCNDVYYNSSSNYSGVIGDQTGINGNISSPALFCAPGQGDFHVLPSSPCAPGNNTCNTVIGGLGVGCYRLQPLIVTGYSPEINMTVIDPDGFYIGKDAGGTLHQTLYPADYNQDGPSTDQITIYYPIEGTYTVEVVGIYPPKMRGSYAMGIRIDGTDEAMMTVNAEVPDPGDPDSYAYVVEDDWHFINGDADRNGTINILDIVYLINYVYKNGPEPYPVVAGEADCNEAINILDIVYLINYVYKNGPEPCQIPE